MQSTVCVSSLVTFNGTAKPYPADHLKEMMQRSMYEKGLTGAYNARCCST